MSWLTTSCCSASATPNPAHCWTSPTGASSHGTRRQAPISHGLPRYRIYRNGELDQEVQDITPFWEDDMVAFLIGCSFSFEAALLANGVPVRHIEDGHNVPMYRTNIACQPAGRLSGPMVVSMRPMPANKVVRAVQVTSRFPSVHGAPVHVGDPRLLGIADWPNRISVSHPSCAKARSRCSGLVA